MNTLAEVDAALRPEALEAYAIARGTYNAIGPRKAELYRRRLELVVAGQRSTPAIEPHARPGASSQPAASAGQPANVRLKAALHELGHAACWSFHFPLRSGPPMAWVAIAPGPRVPPGYDGFCEYAGLDRGDSLNLAIATAGGPVAELLLGDAPATDESRAWGPADDPRSDAAMLAGLGPHVFPGQPDAAARLRNSAVYHASRIVTRHADVIRNAAAVLVDVGELSGDEVEQLLGILI